MSELTFNRIVWKMPDGSYIGTVDGTIVSEGSDKQLCIEVTQHAPASGSWFRYYGDELVVWQGN